MSKQWFKNGKRLLIDGVRCLSDECPCDYFDYFVVSGTTNAGCTSSVASYSAKYYTGNYRIYYYSGAISAATNFATAPEGSSAKIEGPWNRYSISQFTPGGSNRCSITPIENGNFLRIKSNKGYLPGFNATGYDTAEEAELDNVDSYIDVEFNNERLYAWYVDDYSGDNGGIIVYRIAKL